MLTSIAHNTLHEAQHNTLRNNLQTESRNSVELKICARPRGGIQTGETTEAIRESEVVGLVCSIMVIYGEADVLSSKFFGVCPPRIVM